jgi:hypothetical protein
LLDRQVCGFRALQNNVANEIEIKLLVNDALLAF